MKNGGGIFTPAAQSALNRGGAVVYGWTPLASSSRIARSTFSLCVIGNFRKRGLTNQANRRDEGRREAPPRSVRVERVVRPHAASYLRNETNEAQFTRPPKSASLTDGSPT